MIYKREKYIEALAKRQWNGRVKVLTGIRRCGKSTILFELFMDYLIESGVKRENIISVALDDYENRELRDPSRLSEYVRSRCANDQEQYYLFLDEIQFAISNEELKSKDEPIRLYA